MSSLGDTFIADSYPGLLHAGGSPLVTIGQSLIYDGSGNKSALRLGINCNGATICGVLSCDTLMATNVIATNMSNNLQISNSSPTITLTETDIPTTWYINVSNSTFSITKDSLDQSPQPFSISPIGVVTAGIAMTAPSFNSTSSIKHKENVQPIENALDIIKQLQGVSFNWKNNGKEDKGLIAEDVDKVLPEFVLKDENGEPQAIEYSKITSILIEAIKELALLIEK